MFDGIVRSKISPKPARLSLAGFLHSAAMTRSTALESHMYGDPMEILSAQQEREKNPKGKRTKRDFSGVANSPLPELPRRMTIKPSEGSKPRKSLDEFLADEGAVKGWSEARKAAEALFVAPAKGGDHE